MLFIVGFIIVLLSVLGGYAAMGGYLSVLWQPFEYVIIGGAGIGAFLISNPPTVLKGVGKGFKALLGGSKYKKAHYLEILTLQFQVFKLIKQKGILAIEAHVENPDASALFQQFPKFHKDHHAVEFFCDYLRLWTLGSDNPHQMDEILTEELEIHHHEEGAVAHAFQNLGDAFPALGIVAAVLGVIKTMGSISEPPEVLGGLIAGALVGTFFGIFAAYGCVGPMAASMQSAFDAQGSYFKCFKVGLIAHMQGYAPAVSVEFARKSLTSDIRPSFAALEEEIAGLPAPA